MVSRYSLSDDTDSVSIFYLRCRCMFGSRTSERRCYGLPRDCPPSGTINDAVQNIKDAGENAGVYVSIILSIYVLGLLVLLLHHVKQKHGQVIFTKNPQGFQFESNCGICR